MHTSFGPDCQFISFIALVCRKLIGLKKKGKAGQPGDDEPLANVETKGKLMMIGTAEAIIEKLSAQAEVGIPFL